jgi:hypothetical protein
MIAARVAADQAAAQYRASVRSAVEQWREEGSSVRKCAERLGITEGALRDLLRPDGQSRRAKKIEKGESDERPALDKLR